ncbi:copper amine oxidase [Natribacillus halophilus]|uniref:Uncharacterized protein n=1 Tax=Natribacillus halophilus TaxID=549003 RepID=A0A1G8KWQ9_9BACI|nr:copper amine oxidase [Natribacillus halophilus]SDI47898.1 hypothetical protein SAMN04488123_102357 [Natribacillus halophilus]
MKVNRILMLVMSLLLLVPSFAMAADHDDEGYEGDEEADVATPAGDLRADLDYLLSEHAYLAVVAMQKGVDESEDFEEAVEALDGNTEDLTEAITDVYGEEAGQTFNDMWNDHIDFFVDYVTATAEDDEESRQEALDNLEQYRDDFSEFLSEATEGDLPAGDLADGLQAHVDDLIGAFDNYVEEDFEAAYQDIRDAYAHMFHLSEDLAGTITEQFPEDFDNTTVNTPAVDLRSELNHAFSEHAALAILTMQKGIDGEEDFDEAAWALDENTADLTAAVEDVYGEEAGAEFQEMWDEHIDFFVDYVNATAEDDQQGQEEALNSLENYRDDFSAFLSEATEGNMPQEELADGLQAHVDQLITAFDSYVEGDFDTAYDNVREGIHHMYMPAEGLAAAVVTQFPEDFDGEAMPDEMPETGMGGATSGDSGATMIWITLGAFFTLAAGFILFRNRLGHRQ